MDGAQPREEGVKTDVTSVASEADFVVEVGPRLQVFEVSIAFPSQ